MVSEEHRSLDINPKKDQLVLSCYHRNIENPLAQKGHDGKTNNAFVLCLMVQSLEKTTSFGLFFSMEA